MTSPDCLQDPLWFETWLSRCAPRWALAFPVVLLLAGSTVSSTAVSAPGDPQPDIKINGADSGLSLSSLGSATITLGFSSGRLNGSPADWWLVAITPSGQVWYLSPAGSWDSAGTSLDAMLPGYEGPLFDFSALTMPGLSNTETGTFWFYFGVDMDPNRQLDLASTYYDSIGVDISSSQPPTPTTLLQPADFQYLGAFRLPGNQPRPHTFDYGGNAMTFNPNGNPDGPADGFPGSLFISGHDRMAYGTLPDGSRVAEVSIPQPIHSRNLAELNTAGFVQGFSDVFEGWFTDREEIPRIGMQYLDHPATGPKIHACWGRHEEGTFELNPSHVWFEPTLSQPDMQGPWYIGNEREYSINGYMFEIPSSWADAHTPGQYLGTGRFRDGGWGGMGPNLYAYLPWTDSTGTPAAPYARLPNTKLLAYADSRASDDVTFHSMTGYQHPDEWEGSAWITTSTGKTAIIFTGTKSVGTRYWYGFQNPSGPEFPCVHASFIGISCRLADGSSCPAADFTPCCTEGVDCYGQRAWWSTNFEGRILLYNPDDMARVAAGTMESWDPQPYAHLDIDDLLLLNFQGPDIDLIGTDQQRRFRVGDVAYDRANDLIYVLELYADGARPVVHAWRIR